VSERLGHSTVAFTMDVYSHAIPSMEAEAAETIARLVQGHKP
jgi:integrase